jgi:hypothetical protein
MQELLRQVSMESGRGRSDDAGIASQPSGRLQVGASAREDMAGHRRSSGGNPRLSVSADQSASRGAQRPVEKRAKPSVSSETGKQGDHSAGEPAVQDHLMPVEPQIAAQLMAELAPVLLVQQSGRGYAVCLRLAGGAETKAVVAPGKWATMPAPEGAYEQLRFDVCVTAHETPGLVRVDYQLVLPTASKQYCRWFTSGAVWKVGNWQPLVADGAELLSPQPPTDADEAAPPALAPAVTQPDSEPDHVKFKRWADHWLRSTLQALGSGSANVKQ